MSNSSHYTQFESTECIVCRSPLNGDGGERAICDECELAAPERRTKVDSAREITLEYDGVTLTKSLVTEAKRPRIQYTLSSSREETVKVRLLDSVPAFTDATQAGESTRPVDVVWWIPPGEQIQLHRELAADVDTVDSDKLPQAIEYVPWLVLDPERREPSGLNPESYRPQTVPDDDTASASVLAAMPAHNEEDSIGEVVSAARQYADAVLVVDDGSSDETSPRAKDAGAFLVEHDTNRGYGAALKTAFETARHVEVDHLVILDSDGQHDPSDIPVLVEKQQTSGADLVIGNRFDEQAETDLPLYRWFGLTVINVLTNLSIGARGVETRIQDTQSGYRAYSRRAVASLADDDHIGDRMNASTDILGHANRQGYDIAEVETTIRYDVESPSSQNPVLHGYSLVKNIVPTLERERPFLVLGLPGVLFIGGGLGLGLVVLQQAIQTGAFPSVPLFVSLVVTLVGVFSCVTALVLHSLATYHRQPT